MEAEDIVNVVIQDTWQKEITKCDISLGWEVATELDTLYRTSMLFGALSTTPESTLYYEVGELSTFLMEIAVYILKQRFKGK